MEIYKGGRMIQSFVNFITFYNKPKKNKLGKISYAIYR